MSNQTRKGHQWLYDGRVWFALIIGLFVLVMSAPLKAAEVRGGVGDNDIFRLPAGEVISDDLYVGAGEIFIDGTVEGDLVVAGGYIEINGVVTGDVLAAGGGVVINGRVGDDVRAAGGGVTIAGLVGGDLFATGGGPPWPGAPAIPMRIGERQIPLGIQLASGATVGGDAYIFGGQGRLNGTIDGSLFAGMGIISLGGQVGEDARLYGQRIEIDENTQIAGTLTYQSGGPVVLPAGVAASVVQEEPAASTIRTPPPNLAAQMLGWLWRTVLIILGFALLAWLIWQLAPGLVSESATRIAARPVEAGLYGIIAVALLLPVILALIIVMAIFWGLPGALAAAFFLFGAAGLLWMLSSLITGYWLGQWLAGYGWIRGGLAAYLVGALAIVIVARLISLIPCVGVLLAGAIYLLSFALALGGIILSRRRVPVTEPLLGLTG
jgi:hypothetical protein